MEDSHQAASSGAQPLATQKEEMPTSQSLLPAWPEPSSHTLTAGLRSVFMQGTVPLSCSLVQPMLPGLSHSERAPSGSLLRKWRELLFSFSPSRSVLQTSSYPVQRQVASPQLHSVTKEWLGHDLQGKVYSYTFQILLQLRAKCLYLFAGPCYSP